MNAMILNNKMVCFDSEKSYFILWRQKGGRPIPVGKGSSFSPAQRVGYNKKKIKDLQKRKTGVGISDQEKKKIDTKIGERQKNVQKVEAKGKRAPKKKPEGKKQRDEKAALDIEESMQNSPIKERTNLGAGITNPELVTLEDGTQAVFKVNELDMTHMGIEKGGLRKREVAAYEVDKALGFGIVPETTIRNKGGETGSMQKFVKNADSGAVSSATPDSLSFDQMRTMDYLTWNMDRNSGNYLLEKKTNKVIPIDHGMAFPISPSTNRPFNFPTEYKTPKKLPTSIMSALKNVDDEALKSKLGSLGLSSSRITGLFQRKKVLIKTGEAPAIKPF